MRSGPQQIVYTRPKAYVKVTGNRLSVTALTPLTFLKLSDCCFALWGEQQDSEQHRLARHFLPLVYDT